MNLKFIHLINFEKKIYEQHNAFIKKMNLNQFQIIKELSSRCSENKNSYELILHVNQFFINKKIIQKEIYSLTSLNLSNFNIKNHSF